MTDVRKPQITQMWVVVFDDLYMLVAYVGYFRHNISFKPELTIGL